MPSEDHALDFKAEIPWVDGLWSIENIHKVSALPDSRSGSISFCYSDRYSCNQAPHDQEFREITVAPAGQGLPINPKSSPKNWA